MASKLNTDNPTTNRDVMIKNKKLIIKNNTYMNFFKGHTSALRGNSSKNNRIKCYVRHNKNSSEQRDSVKEKFNREILMNMNPRPLKKDFTDGK